MQSSLHAFIYLLCPNTTITYFQGIDKQTASHADPCFVITSTSGLSFDSSSSVLPQSAVPVMGMLGVSIHHAATDVVPAPTAHHPPGVGRVHLAAHQQIDRSAAYVARLLPARGIVAPGATLGLGAFLGRLARRTGIHPNLSSSGAGSSSDSSDDDDERLASSFPSSKCSLEDGNE